MIGVTCDVEHAEALNKVRNTKDHSECFAITTPKSFLKQVCKDKASEEVLHIEYGRSVEKLDANMDLS